MRVGRDFLAFSLVLGMTAPIFATDLAWCCPIHPQITEQNGTCLLQGNSTLEQTLLLSSGMTLDCQGHSLRPQQEGLAKSGTNPHRPSVPVAAVLLKDTTQVTVKNCVIENFDFGIVAMGDQNANQAEWNTIGPDNILSNLYQGVTIIESDNIEIKGNLFNTQGIGPGIEVLLDSDNVIIRDNFIQNGRRPTGENFQAVPLYPGSPLIGNGSILTDGIGYYKAPPMGTVNVDGETFSFVKDSSKRATGGRAENNTIYLLKNSINAVGIFVNEFQDGLIIKENFIKNASDGIGLTFGKVGGNSERDFWSSSVVVEGNRIEDSLFVGIQVGETFSPTIQNNFINSRLNENNENAGIVLKGIALESATVTRNQIRDMAFGIRLVKRDAQYFEAEVYLNDFTKTKVGGVDTSPDYDILTFLAYEDLGNYWGRSCNDSEGFRDADEPNQRQKTDSPFLFVTDPHPFGEPVAKVPDHLLPNPCH